MSKTISAILLAATLAITSCASGVGIYTVGRRDTLTGHVTYSEFFVDNESSESVEVYISGSKIGSVAGGTAGAFKGEEGDMIETIGTTSHKITQHRVLGK